MKQSNKIKGETQLVEASEEKEEGEMKKLVQRDEK